MTQRETDLPEGTDKVVSGAMDTDLDRLQNTGAISTPAGEPRKRTSGGGSRSGSRKSGSAGGSTGNAIMEKVRSGSDKLSEQAADKARGFVGQGIERSAETLSNVGKLVGDTASGLDERLGKEYGDYARRAAETLESTADKIASKDPDELIDDTRTFIRKSPGVALAGAAIVGFALARLVKSGLSAGDGDDEDDRGSQSPRKRS
ncbi:MAG: hypothetical protein ACR2JJ_07755 [Sphingomicrobium sp.]